LPHEKTKTKTFPTREKTKTLNKAFQLEDKVSRSWGKREGEPSAEVCDRLSRTRVSSQRQLPTDHDYAVPTREYQLDQSSPLPASAAADPALVRKNNQRTLTGHYISTSGLPTIRPELSKVRPIASRNQAMSLIASDETHNSPLRLNAPTADQFSV